MLPALGWDQADADADDFCLPDDLYFRGGSHSGRCDA
jgi:hypothetical protein